MEEVNASLSISAVGTPPVKETIINITVADESSPDLSTPLTPHITYISYEEYIEGIKNMCKTDKLFMKQLKAFCDASVEDEKDVLPPKPSIQRKKTKSTME